MEGQDNPLMRLMQQLADMLEGQAAAQAQNQQLAQHQGQALLNAIQQQTQAQAQEPRLAELPRMVEADDAEAFLATFETSVSECHWQSGRQG